MANLIDTLLKKDTERKIAAMKAKSRSYINKTKREMKEKQKEMQKTQTYYIAKAYGTLK